MAQRDHYHDRSPQPDSEEDLLRTSDVAALFQVSTRTVSEWAQRGRVPCLRTPGGQWRFPAGPIRRLVVQAEHSPWDDLSEAEPTPSPG